ncbi:hypothetical protein DL767_003871 [Monosporascus sp. MG133]|nr:hypothetical protein DL767_003871 [Monosporascus sp. MG133]
MTVDDYVSLFIDANLRWEAVGNIFAVAGRSLMATLVNDALLDDGLTTRESLLSQISEAINLCLSLCNHVSCSNELLVSLQVNDVMLKTLQFGDSSYQAWRRLADLSATLYYTGIHQQPSLERESESDPAFLTQWKRGCFAAAFYVDKCLATFFGRPPLLNYRHCNLTLPLDLSDDVLVADAASFAESVGDLNADGWNNRGQVHRSSLARIRMLLAIFRAQVLEITAARYDDSVSPRAYQVLEEARVTWERCPDILRYDRYDHDACVEHASHADMFTIVSAYLDYLHSRFLLLQYLGRQADENNWALLGTARQIVATIVKTITYRMSLIDMSRDYSWIRYAISTGIMSSTSRAPGAVDRALTN